MGSDLCEGVLHGTGPSPALSQGMFAFLQQPKPLDQPQPDKLAGPRQFHDIMRSLATTQSTTAKMPVIPGSAMVNSTTLWTSYSIHCAPSPGLELHVHPQIHAHELYDVLRKAMDGVWGMPIKFRLMQQSVPLGSHDS